MHKLLSSCFGGRSKEKVDVHKAPPNSRHAPNNFESDGLAASQPSTPICAVDGQPPPLPVDPLWEYLSWEATPFSVAVVTSDAKEVLFKRPGLEPAAAQLLEQALLFSSASHPLNAPFSQKGGSLPAGNGTCSFLTALLGPELEAVAVKRARQERWWRGTISAQLPVQRGAPCLGGTSVGRGSASACPTPPRTQLEPKGTASGCFSSSQEAALPWKEAMLLPESASAEMQQVPCNSTPAATAAASVAAPAPAPVAAARRCGSAPAESIQSESTLAGIPAATAAAAKRRGSAPEELVKYEGTSSAPAGRQGSAPVELCSTDPRSSRGSSVRGTGKSAIKHHVPSDAPSHQRQEDISKRVQWDCPKADFADEAVMSDTLHQVKGGVFANHMLSQSSPQASLQNTIMSAPVLGNAPAQRSSVRKPRGCLSRQRCDLLAEKQNEGEERREEEMQSPSSLSRASSCRSRQGLRESKPTINRHSSFSRRSSLLLTPAIEAALEQGGGTEEGATRTVALLKSLSQGAKNEARGEDRSFPLTQSVSLSMSASQSHQQDQDDAGVLANLSYVSVPSMSLHTSGQPSTVSDTSNVVISIAPTSAFSPSLKAREDMQAAERIEKFVSFSPFGNASGPSAASNPESAAALGSPHRSVEGAHDLYQPTATSAAEQRNYTPRPTISARMSQKSSCSAVQNLDVLPEEERRSIKDCANPLSLEPYFKYGTGAQHGPTESPMPLKDLHGPRSEASSLVLPLEPAERASQSTSEDEIPTQSFDVMVTTLSEDARTPLFVSILNCTEHWQVRATLTTLAEAQLELLSSLMPQHAIQFLAMESTDAVPENVGQLARAHSDVTLLFMDIVGFTSMSKNVKPVQVMVFLNKLFSLFDRMTDVHKVHKVETAGDCYIVGGGIISQDQCANGFRCVTQDQDPAESAKQVMEFAKALLETAKQVKMPDTNEPVRVRVGLHTGDVVSGLIGSKMPKFSIFGDTMNTASRMESTGVPGRIHVSETTQRLLMHESWESTGGVEVKGKGRMQTYLWMPPASDEPSMQQQVQPTLAGSSVDPLPCSFIKQAQQAHTFLKHLGPAPTPSSTLGRLNNEVFVAEVPCQRAN